MDTSGQQQTTEKMAGTIQRLVLPLLLHVAWILSAVPLANTEEYCQMEKFNGKCPPDHVVMMQIAQYGRMKLGRCLTRDYFVGCTADVLGHMDERCSGQRECLVEMPDPTMNRAQPCPKDLVAYMEADYTCIKEQGMPAALCRKGAALRVMGSSGYVTSNEARGKGLGTADCPWNITVQPGQRINITLFDFNAYGSMVSGGGRHQEKCNIYAKIYEMIEGSEQETVVCAARKRQHVVYASKTHTIRVQVQTHPGDNPPSFALKYDAVGCADPNPPVHATMRRHGEQVNIVCNNSQQSWHLVCKDTKWVGDIANCSSEIGHSTKLETGVSKNGLLNFPNGLLLAVVIGIALGLLIGVCLLVVVYTIRRRRRRCRRDHFMKEANALLGQEHIMPGDMRKQDIAIYDSRENATRLVPRPDNVEITTTIPMTFIRHGDHVYEKTMPGGGLGQEVKVLHPGSSPVRHVVPNYCAAECPDVVDVNTPDMDRMKTLPLGCRSGHRYSTNSCGCDFHSSL